MKRLVVLLAAAAVLAPDAGADAAMVTYLEIFTLSGSLGNTTFTNAQVTFTQTADTNSVIQLSPLGASNQDLTSTISIEGGASASFLDPTYTLDSYNSRIFGTSFELNMTNGGGIGKVTSQEDGDTYPNALSVSTGPVTGLAFYQTVASYDTSAGALTIDSFSSTGIFQTSVAAVPEPASVALMASGLVTAGLTGWYRSRRRKIG